MELYKSHMEPFKLSPEYEEDVLIAFDHWQSYSMHFYKSKYGGWGYVRLHLVAQVRLNICLLLNQCYKFAVAR